MPGLDNLCCHRPSVLPSASWLSLIGFAVSASQPLHAEPTVSL